jgi:hypothetical protein
MEKIKEKADEILYNLGLLNKLDQYGKTHVIGSYFMNLMVWNDLDIDVENENICLKDIHELLKFVIDNFYPVWIEGKKCILGKKLCYFIGFETNILNELWNVDIWFFDKTEIAKCKNYCEEINKKLNEDLQKVVIEMKRKLIENGQYSTRYNSVDVYDAVINKNIRTVDELYEKYKK